MGINIRSRIVTVEEGFKFIGDKLYTDEGSCYVYRRPYVETVNKLMRIGVNIYKLISE